jgi:hypothetical protein
MTLLAQVIGFGPAALGLPLAADRTGNLSALAARGLAFVDRERSAAVMRTTRFPYLVESNSTAADFLAAVHPAGRFAPVMHGPAGRALAERAGEPVALRVVGQYLAALAESITSWLREGAGEIIYGQEIRWIRRAGDGTFTSLTADLRPVLRSQAVVLATGAREDTHHFSGRLGVDPARVVGSADILMGQLESAVRVAGAGGRIVIIGGSHSGFSVAGLLLRHCATLDEAQITIVHRGITLAFPSLAAMSRSPWGALSPPTVCPDTGMVNRFRGLRNRARELCTAALCGTERRIRLCEAASPQAASALAEAALIVYAAGYRSTTPDLIDDDGTPIPLPPTSGYVAVDDQCHVLGPDGPVPDLYGIGIGFARISRYGERRAALNFFHGPDAEDIVRALMQPVTT